MYHDSHTPQTEPLRGSSQVENSAGGYSWRVDKWTRLERFLILGTESGSYYASPRTLTRESASSVIACIEDDPIRTIRTIVDISHAGRAAKNSPAIFALSLALRLADERGRRYARDHIPSVCRTGTHLFELMECLRARGMRGLNRRLQDAVARWYTSREPESLAYQLIKYRSRGGWTHRDILRLAKPRGHDREGAYSDLFEYAVRGTTRDRPCMRQIVGAAKIKTETSAREAARLIRASRLPRECVPTALLNHAGVWEALLDEPMGLTALVRNLGKMTAVGLLKPFSEATKVVCARLTDASEIQRARLHPLTALMAGEVYRNGCGVRGSLRWHPVTEVMEALESAFYLGFRAVTPANKRTLIGLDVSGSMGIADIAGTCVTPRSAAAAMCLVTRRTEPECHVHAFSGDFVAFPVTCNDSLGSVIQRTTDMEFGPTDCSIPMLYASKQKIEVDTFVIYTDSETFFGEVHPAEALRRYRRRMGIPARLVVVGMVANDFSIADPDDGGMMDVVGFDTSAPEIMASFSRGGGKNENLYSR